MSGINQMICKNCGKDLLKFPLNYQHVRVYKKGELVDIYVMCLTKCRRRIKAK